MGLTQTFQDAAVTTFAAFGDLIKQATYTRIISNPTHNPLTGAVTSDEETFTVSFLFDKFHAEDVHGTYKKTKDVVGENVLPTDELATIPGLSFKNALGVVRTPEMDDELTKTSDSSRWKVIEVFTDPAEAVWALQIRRLS